MNSYVQLEGFGFQWFRVFKKGDEFNDKEEKKNVNKLTRKVTLDSFRNFNDDSKISKYQSEDLYSRLQYCLDLEIGIKTIDYESKANEYGTILIRESGSWMLLEGNKIVNTKTAKYYPTEKSDIVICENDERCEQFWLNYLKEEFPKKSIVTLNHFSTKSVDEIRKNLKGVKLITFSTTLGETSWYENMLKANVNNTEILGFFHIESKKEIALKLAEKYDKTLNIVHEIL